MRGFRWVTTADDLSHRAVRETRMTRMRKCCAPGFHVRDATEGQETRNKLLSRVDIGSQPRPSWVPIAANIPTSLALHGENASLSHMVLHGRTTGYKAVNTLPTSWTPCDGCRSRLTTQRWHRVPWIPRPAMGPREAVRPRPFRSVPPPEPPKWAAALAVLKVVSDFGLREKDQ